MRERIYKISSSQSYNSTACVYKGKKYFICVDQSKLQDENLT